MTSSNTVHFVTSSDNHFILLWGFLGFAEAREKPARALHRRANDNLLFALRCIVELARVFLGDGDATMCGLGPASRVNLLLGSHCLMFCGPS